ncbi:hypothetical protein L2E82_21147 [Cichorium intybus]|uniref:Uncharacterized protein n=1 Tax=Cichorium intybus TaxID=13427 RepID=A0ACB9DVK7_CICIN|nr:hypothetical protein L2E82_21147 [Cichorium intybus]
MFKEDDVRNETSKRNKATQELDLDRANGDNQGGESKAENDVSKEDDTHVADSVSIANNGKAIEDRGEDHMKLNNDVNLNMEENEGIAKRLSGEPEQKENELNDNTSHSINQFDVPGNHNPCLKSHHRSDTVGARSPNNVTGDDPTEGSTSNPGGNDDMDFNTFNEHSDDSIDLNVEPDEGIGKLGEDMIRSQDHPKKHRNKDNKGKKPKAAKNNPASVKFKDVVRAYNFKKSRRSDSLPSNRSNHRSPSKSSDSISIELGLTKNVGSAIGFQIEGFEHMLRSEIEGEGGKKN